jgi:hypothetical protein
MSARVTRRIAAGTTALALAGFGLIGLGASAASAVDTVPPSPTFGGTFYLADGAVGTDFAPGTTQIPFNLPTLAMPAPGDLTNPVAANPAAWGATQAWDFLSPVGQETNKSAWNAYTSTIMAANGQLQENTFPNGLLNAGTGSPSGQAAVAAQGGDYSLGIAYTSNAGVTIVKVIYVHIHVTAGTTSTATYTYQPVQAAVVKTATTTSLASSATTVNTGQQFTLTATVAPAAATGTVEFFAGTTSLGTAPVVSGGTAALTTASLSAAGANSITAVYSGDSAYSGSTSTAVVVTANLAPITTTTSVAATSADNVALHPATLTATVAPAGSAGSVVFSGSVNGGAVQAISGTVPVTAGQASITISGLTQGVWTINAAFTGTSPYVNSASTVAATLTLTAAAYPSATPSASNVTVSIPAGSLVITTPWSSGTPLSLGTAVLDSATSTWSTPVTNFASATDQSKAIQVIDTRAGVPGFTAQVSSSDFANGPQTFPVTYMGLINVAAHQVANNAIQANQVTTNDVASLSGSAQTFAQYHPASSTLGTAWISGDLKLAGVPTSVQPGTYTATLTFTAF